MKFNLGDVILKNEAALIGRPNGENCLEKARRKGIDFKKLEETHQIIEIEVPDFVISINESFFLGFFETMIQRAGSKEAFLNKYHFITSPHIKDKIQRHIEHGLLRSSQNDILGV